MSDLLAARAQMGTSLAFHIIFASLGIGLPLLLGFVAISLPDPSCCDDKQRCQSTIHAPGVADWDQYWHGVALTLALVAFPCLQRQESCTERSGESGKASVHTTLNFYMRFVSLAVITSEWCGLDGSPVEKPPRIPVVGSASLPAARSSAIVARCSQL